MIVNPTSSGWECIYQRAHAWLAYRLLLDFRPSLRAPHWDAVLFAALTHDHGWMEWDEAQLTPEGEPCSFIDGTAEKAKKLSRRTVNLAAHQSIEGAILVARHAEELYGSREEPSLLECIQEIRSRRFRWMERLGQTEAEVEKDYEQVLWADSASLILCVTDPDFVSGLKLEIGGREYALEENDGHWTLDPWPYQVDEMKIGVETFCLDQKAFERLETFRCRLETAKAIRKTWLLRPTSR